ncbi:hypothetical protein B586_01965 [Mycobacterium haemophilum DSM 44634]|nr:hypothetical protein B586_01965 [Mycobacterium haemophilum DSM 44634]
MAHTIRQSAIDNIEIAVPLDRDGSFEQQIIQESDPWYWTWPFAGGRVAGLCWRTCRALSTPIMF